jgi:hypothetical protein
VEEVAAGASGAGASDMGKASGCAHLWRNNETLWFRYWSSLRHRSGPPRAAGGHCDPRWDADGQGVPPRLGSDSPLKTDHATSDRQPQVLRNLKRLHDHGRPDGSGYLSILPEDRRVEHAAGASLIWIRPSPIPLGAWHRVLVRCVP